MDISISQIIHTSGLTRWQISRREFRGSDKSLGTLFDTCPEQIRIKSEEMASTCLIHQHCELTYWYVYLWDMFRLMLTLLLNLLKYSYCHGKKCTWSNQAMEKSAFDQV